MRPRLAALPSPAPAPDLSASSPASPELGGTPASVARTGLLAAAVAYASWGVFPLYFRALAGVPATVILAHRICWSVLLLGGVLLLRRGFGELHAARAHAGRLLATTLLLSANWLTYIWAVETGQVLEASLGYFITPLVSVALGMAVLGERLRPVQVAAVGLAALGVLVPVLLASRPPWIALGLAASFGTYGLLRKGLPLPAIPALFVETALMAPAAVGWLLWRVGQGQPAWGLDGHQDALLVGTGLITTAPLLLFAVGARRLPLTTMGMLQYLSPVGQLLVALLAFGEPLSGSLALTFGCTWAGLLLVTGDALRRRGRQPRFQG
ncbi:EamA family transporter RarD [Myxococcota bacterium]|nr:EamA family transporter RarD [Myxococcota bacterium]